MGGVTDPRENSTAPVHDDEPLLSITRTRRRLLDVVKDDLSYELVSGFAGDHPLGARQWASLEQMRRDRGHGFNVDLLATLVNMRFAADKARELWFAIIARKLKMRGLLGRDPGVAVAALDYLVNEAQIIRAPALLSEPDRNSLAEVALRDGLTGLYNWATGMLRLREEVARHRRYGRSCSVLMADVDNFKQLNDKHGHLAGDRVLRQIGSVIRHSIRATDIAARYGGDELFVIAPNTELDDAVEAAQRICCAIRQTEVCRTYGVAISVGVAALPLHGGDAGEVLSAADAALYCAKHAGKDRVACAERAEEQRRLL
ncbi:MAG: GGDEF domain-containing protein [Deltaproteobacteria bacterium]|nr:GGDEF domain-containing protein [Deltaproteobacteria bacterium]